MSAIKKSELVRDRQHQTEFATVNGNKNVKGTIGQDAKQRADNHGGINWRTVGIVTPLCALALTAFSNTASAVPAVPPIAATFDQIYGVIDPATMSYAIATLGGAALVAAFSVGGGFKIGKKAYGWVMGKL